MKMIIYLTAFGGLRETFGLTAMGTTLIGIWLQWKRPSHLSEVEESVKNGRMAAEEARQRIRFIDWRAPALVVTGVGLLVFAAVGWGD